MVEVGSPLKPQSMTSVVRTPEADTVTSGHGLWPERIAEVPRAATPFAITETFPEPPPLPHGAPVPSIAPDELTCTHWVEPVIPVSVIALKVPAAGVVPPIAGGVAKFCVAKVPRPVISVFEMLLLVSV